MAGADEWVRLRALGLVLLGRCPSGQRKQAVNLPAYAYGGSNPSRPTKGDRFSVANLKAGCNAPRIWLKNVRGTL